MKEVKKITVKNFCEEYRNKVTQMQETYIKDNLVITPYVPFNVKNVLADKLVDISTYVFKDYVKEDGTIGRRKTDNIKVNSTIQYLLFCRLLIENYTNLMIENDSFHEEYDMLKECGLLDKLTVCTETKASLIPPSEIAEFRAIIDMKQKDAIFNATEVHNYISSQVERFGTLTGVVLKPVMDRIAEKLEHMTEEDVDKLEKKVDKMMKRVK